MDHQTKQYSRTLTKETASEPSFRILYYGDKGAAVPFNWESQPGTPKHPLFSDYSTLPPLTPPPSYLARSRREPDPKSKIHRGRRLKMVVFLAAVPRLIRRGGSHVSSSSSSYSLSSSSSMSSCGDLAASYYTWGRKTRPWMFALVDEEEEVEMRMCFGGRFGSLKNAFFSVVGGGRRRRSSSHGCNFA